MKKQAWVTLIIIAIVLVASAIILINRSNQNINAELAKCIGQNSELYTQLGCHACETQKNLFGNNYQYLNVIDCFEIPDKCIEKGITATPTWIINGQKYVSIQKIETLKDLTGC